MQDRRRQELELRRQELMNSLSGQSSAPPELDRKSMLEQRRQELLGSLQQHNKKEGYSLGERALQPVRGFVQTVGDMGKMAYEGVKPVLKSAFPLLHRGVSEKFEGMPLKPLPETMSEIENPPETANPVDVLAGKSLEPKADDTLGQVLHEAGSFMVGPAGRAGTIGKSILKNVVPAITAAAAVKATPHLTDEEGLPRVGEDLVKILAGSAAGSKMAGMANYITDLAKSGKYKDAFSNLPMKAAAKISSIPTNANERVFELAEKHKVKLPFNVGMDSTIHNFTANSALKSAFVGKVYKKTLQEADQSMIDAVRRNVDTLGAHNVPPHEASLQFRNFLKEEQELAKTEARKLYDYADEALKDTDVVIPSHTAKTIDFIKKNVLNTSVKNEASKKLSKAVADIEKLIVTPATTMRIKGEKSFGVMGKQSINPISPKQLNKEQSALRQIIDYESDVQGMDNWFNALAKSLEKDMEKSANTEYVSRLKSAKEFYKTGIIDRFRTILSRGIMTGELPKDAVNMLSTVDAIDMLEKAAGNTPKGKELFDSLKKARIREILKNAIEGEYQTGTVRMTPLSKIFSKSEKRDAVLHRLMGAKSYKDMREVSEIAEEFSKSGRELLNTSGSALTHSDFSKLHGAASAAAGYALGTGNIAMLGASVSYLATPYILSKLVSNSEFTSLAKQYAIQRARNNNKAAENIFHRMVPKIMDASKMLAIEELNEEREE